MIVDTVGTAPLSRSKASLGERGRLVLVLATLPQMLGIPSPHPRLEPTINSAVN